VISLLILTGGASAFDVASTKRAAPGAGRMFIRPLPGGGVSVTNMTLKELIVIAYRIQPFQISGAPGWLDSVHYDIEAKPDAAVKQSEWPSMLRALLADRFRWCSIGRAKSFLIYALVLARKDGKLGPGMTESKEGGCTPYDASHPPPPPNPANRRRSVAATYSWE
jgi:uncharacterized protein (TIGR03435 family)